MEELLNMLIQFKDLPPDQQKAVMEVVRILYESNKKGGDSNEDA